MFKGNKVKLLYITVMVLLVSCGRSDIQDSEITVAAASDVYHAFTEIGETYTEHTGVKITFTFGSTGLLSQQINQGAPYDLFAAAHESYIDDLISESMVVPETKQYYAQGRIVMITSDTDTTSNIKGLNNTFSPKLFLEPEVQSIALANPEHAPYGQAAKEALTHLGIWEEIQDKLVYGENVRQAYQFVETGNADLGIVALALAKDAGRDFILLDADTHQPIIQAMAIPVQSKKQDQAQDFARFIRGEEGQRILTKYGFDLPGES